MAALPQFEGLRATPAQASPSALPAAPLRSGRLAFRVVAAKTTGNRAVTRKEQVVLTRDLPELGRAGELKSVAVGYFRNYLLPQGLATVATQDVLADIKAQQEAAAAAKAAEKGKAEAMATALRTIGKFVIKKKVGEGDAIFGSVTAQEVCDAIQQQTGKALDKKALALPDIKALGTYDCTVKLHAEVVGAFKVVVQKEKQA